MSDREDATGTTTLVEKPKQAVAVRQPSALEQLAGGIIRTPNELVERIRALQDKCHLLTPAVAVAGIAPGYVVNVSVVPIDPSVDPETGSGADVYFNPSIHKFTGRGDDRRPVEVSLNKIGLAKILAGVGVNVHTFSRRDDGRTPNLWILEVRGDVTDFDGRTRMLPPGLVEVDLRDGSPQIGGWTPEQWAENLAAARKKAGAKPDDPAWKFRPDPIGGWTEERVMQQRRSGMSLARTKAVNAMVRGMGIKQKFTIKELLDKPFVALRAQWQPDMTDPEVRRIVTASRLNATHLLYPSSGAVPPHMYVPEMPAGDDSPVTHAVGDPATVLPGQVVRDDEREPANTTKPASDAPPDDCVEFEVTEPTRTPRYTIVKGRRRGEGAAAQYFFETNTDVVLFTTDTSIAKALDAARKSKASLAVVTERTKVDGRAYQSVIEIEGGPQQDLGL